MFGTIVGIILIIFVVLILISCVKVVPQSKALVVERLGAYQATWGVGIHFKIPFIERVARRVDLKEQVVDFAPQPVITKDNVTMRIDTVVFYQITDPKLFCYGVANPIMAIENLTATTLRNIIGDLELDQTLTSRETINTKMRATLDVATDPWGIKVKRVELKNIIPPAAIQDAMEKQMKAERERREAILRAEGEKKSSILVAEGQKQSTQRSTVGGEAGGDPAGGGPEGSHHQGGGRPGGGHPQSAAGQRGRYPVPERGGRGQGGPDHQEPGGVPESGGRQGHEDHHPLRDPGDRGPREIRD